MGWVSPADEFLDTILPLEVRAAALARKPGDVFKVRLCSPRTCDINGEIEREAMYDARPYPSVCVGLCGWVQVKSERGHHLIKIEDVLFDLRYLHTMR